MSVTHSTIISPHSICNMISVFCCLYLLAWSAGPLARSPLDLPGSESVGSLTANSSISFESKIWMKLWMAQSAGGIQACVDMLYSGGCTSITNHLLRIPNIHSIMFQAWACQRLYISLAFCGLPCMRRENWSEILLTELQLDPTSQVVPNTYGMRSEL